MLSLWLSYMGAKLCVFQACALRCPFVQANSLRLEGLITVRPFTGVIFYGSQAWENGALPLTQASALYGLQGTVNKLEPGRCTVL